MISFGLGFNSKNSVSIGAVYVFAISKPRSNREADNLQALYAEIPHRPPTEKEKFKYGFAFNGLNLVKMT